MRRSYETRALLLRRVDYRESDLVVTFLTEDVGKLSAMIRGGRRSTKRAGGALESMQTARISLEERGENISDLATLKGASIERARIEILRDLRGLEAAGTALRWVRHACPERMPEPEIFAELNELLDVLDARAAARVDDTSVDSTTAKPDGLLARFGLRLLDHVGWGLELGQCVVCGKARPPGRAAVVVASRGGVVCRSCGGEAAGRALPGAVVDRVAVAETGDADTDKAALDLVTAALAAHAGFAEVAR